MVSRRPLVVGSDGLPQQLQAGDTLFAVVTDPSPPPGPVGLIFPAENKDLPMIPAGGACAIHLSGEGVVLASAVDNSKRAVGLMQTPVNTNLSGNVQFAGTFSLPDWTEVTGDIELVPNAHYFVGVDPGKLTLTHPSTLGEVVQIAAVAITLNTLLLLFSDPILL